MVLDHERLDVYLVALDFLVFANEVIERLPRGRGHLADQLTRASTSIVSESGRSGRASSRRPTSDATTSRREAPRQSLRLCSTSACDCGSLDRAEYRTGKAMIVRVVSMLIKLAQACEE